jgi:hypothetical protein
MNKPAKTISCLAAIGLVAATAVLLTTKPNTRGREAVPATLEMAPTSVGGYPESPWAEFPTPVPRRAENTSTVDAPAIAAAESPADTPQASVGAASRRGGTEDLAALRASLLGAVRRDPADALATLTALPLSNRLKIDIGGEMLGLWTADDPRAAAAWAEQNRWPRELGGPVVKVADEWARQDPAAALDWASSLASGLDQVGAIIAATGRWSKTDFSAVAAHVGRQPRGLPRDVMAGTLAREFGQEDPLAGLQWALIVEDPVGRERAAAGAIADVHAADPARAELLLQSAGLPPEFRQAVEKRVAGPLPWWH